MKIRFIVNPKSGGGEPAKRWPHVREFFRGENWDFDVAFTENRGHGTALALAALKDGCDLLVTLGGDGLIHEVVNGMFREGKAVNPAASLAIIPCGTGNDLGRALHLPGETMAAARHLARSKESRLIDLGEAACVRDGKREWRVFANDADLGFAAEVVERVTRTGKFSRGTAPYFVGILRTALQYRNQEMALEANGRAIRGKMTTVLICNGQSTGGGMRVAPDAILDDGLFDVVVAGDLRPWEIIWHAPKIYRGAHVRVRKVSVHRTRTVSVTSPQRLPVAADGELIGEGPVSFRVLPAALRVRV